MGFCTVRATVAALAVTASLIAGACSIGRSGYQFVRSPSTGTYLKVPADWKVFGSGDYMAEVEKQGLSVDEFKARFPFWSSFDASSQPQLRPIGDPTTARPNGVLRVTVLSPEERDATSFATLREDLFPGLNAAAEAGQIDVVRGDDIEQDHVRGQRLVFRITDPDTEVSGIIDQTTLVDHATSRSYVLAITCNAKCYEQNRKQIDIVVKSLTIKEK